MSSHELWACKNQEEVDKLLNDIRPEGYELMDNLVEIIPTRILAPMPDLDVELLKGQGIARKDDKDKPDYSLLTSAMLEPMIRGFMHGETKYSRGNFKQGFVNTRLTAAAMRHIMAWNDGEDVDPESGHSHLGHAMAALAMLCDNIAEGTSTEGRYGREKKGA